LDSTEPDLPNIAFEFVTCADRTINKELTMSFVKAFANLQKAVQIFGIAAQHFAQVANHDLD